ncbi:hypothetical protein N798_12130 [Knoellia flava TL1]|uniref:MFS transporter n=1 Tax=Knoellia flava TL1 TaxID=1385518 RepID=A0ABR4XC30_9MICO|nr:hypothetical protein N798_12130 [Knoellia flava TL1]
MFGSVGAFVNGNMFAGLFGDSLGVKLDDAASRSCAPCRAPGRSGRRSGR